MTRTLKYAILGLLMQKPMTGYDIAKEFKESAFANFWFATHGQIYPELKKLVLEGSVLYDVVIEAKVLEKKVYQITDQGKEDFMTWLSSDEDIPPTPKDVFRLRTYFSEFMECQDLCKMFHEEIQKHQFKLDTLSAIEKTNFSQIPEAGTAAMGDYMVLEGAIIREKTYIIWLYQCLTLNGESVPASKLKLK